MQPPALDADLLQLSDAALQEVVETFLQGLAERTSTHAPSAERLHFWCQILGFRLLLARISRISRLGL